MHIYNNYYCLLIVWPSAKALYLVSTMLSNTHTHCSIIRNKGFERNNRIRATEQHSNKSQKATLSNHNLVQFQKLPQSSADRNFFPAKQKEEREKVCADISAMKMWEYFEYLFKTNCIFFSNQFKTVICQDIYTWNIVVRVYMDYVTNCFGQNAKLKFFQVQFNLVRRITDCRHSN